jgi:protein-disulfide isomerase
MKLSHLSWITVGIIILAIAIEFIIPIPDVIIPSFNYSLHNQLDFEDTYRGTNPESNLTFVMFMDFDCPICKEQYPDLRKLMQYYPEVNFLFKHLITTTNEGQVYRAQAFECARIVDKAYDLANLFFDDVTTNVAINQLSLNENNAFNECMDNKNITQLVMADSYHASYLEVRGSPTFFLNGIKIEGAHPYDVYAALIEIEMK